MKTRRLQRASYLSGALAVFGVVLSPVVASAVTANTTITATLDTSISMTTSTTVAISVTPTSGGSLSSNSDSISVSTNNTTGYTLTFKDADTNTNLVSSGNNIATSGSAPGSAAALSNNTWGFAVAGNTGFDASYSAETNNGSSTSKWAGVPASSGTAYQIKTTATTASNDASTVWYATKVTSSQPNGTYSDTVTYTAVANS